VKTVSKDSPPGPIARLVIITFCSLLGLFHGYAVGTAHKESAESLLVIFVGTLSGMSFWAVALLTWRDGIREALINRASDANRKRSHSLRFAWLVIRIACGLLFLGGGALSSLVCYVFRALYADSLI
jgi:hypothetical protein